MRWFGMNIRKEDLVVLSYLRNNARELLTRISKATQIPVSTLYDRINRYDKNLIKRHTVLLDYDLLGFSVRVKMAIKAAVPKKEELKEFLMKSMFVNSLYKINNGYDFLLEGVFKNMGQAEEFVENLEKTFQTRSVDVYYLLNEIKHEAFLSNPMVADLVVG